jgi:uncharacterized membrane protein
MLYGIVLPLHAGAMAAALVSFVVVEVFLLASRQGRRLPARVALLASNAANLMASLGVLGGVALVFIGGWSLLTPWLLASLVLIAVLMGVQRRLVRPWEAEVRTLLESEASSAGIRALATRRTALLGRATVIVLFSAVAGLMAIKPQLPFP